MTGAPPAPDELVGTARAVDDLPEPAPAADGAPYRVMLEVAYDGSPYVGFVRQTNGPTVAAELERAIAQLDPRAGSLTCSSRTDAGVHARHQIVSFLSQRLIPARGWVLGLRPHLPPSVSVVGAALVPLSFDPRLDPVWKRYRYRVLVSPVPDPFEADRAYWIFAPLDLDKMRQAAAPLMGEHDFRAFRSARDQRTSTVRRVDGVDVVPALEDPRRVDIVVTGHRFLHNMVRIIAGTLVDVGRGRLEPECTARALDTGQREALGMTAPAHGLYLEHVELGTPLTGKFPTFSRT